MWSYRQPDFALHLLHELQRQQRGGLLCDTLLQTEGVSVPAHSCVLSALSPVFSRALTNSPSLPAGHSRLVKLQAVGARALLKLVGFLYSGEIEGEGLREQEEFISAAHKLGFSNLIDGLKGCTTTKQQDRVVRRQEIGLQTEDAERVQVLESFTTHSETQTDSPDAHLADASPAFGSEPSLTGPCQYRTSSSAIELHSIKDITAFSSASVSEASTPVNSKSCQQINVDPFRRLCQREKPNVARTQSELLDSGVLGKVKRVRGKDFRKLVGKLGCQSCSTFRQQEDTQISLKIKLKRRRRGAQWEIVSIQEDSRADKAAASPGKTQSRTEEGVTLTQPLRSCAEVLSPSPTVARQGLATVTLTPPIDLTMSPPTTPAEQSGPHSPKTLPPSSHIEMPPPSPGVLQAEESDEHIASLLEDMVMLGLNILPSAPINKNNDLHHQNDKHASPELHPDLKTGQRGAVSTVSAPCLSGRSHSVPTDARKAAPSTGSSAQGEAGPESPGCESQSKSGTAELKNVTSTATSPTSCAITSPSAASQKDSDPSFMLPYSVSEKVLASSLPFGTGGLEPPHQNVGELRNELDHLLWTPDDYVQPVKQTKSKTSKGHHGNVQTSGGASSSMTRDAVNRVSTVIQTRDTAEAVFWREPQVLPDHQPHIVHKGTGSADGADLNEMRLPRCLSPLVSEKRCSSGYTKDCLRPSSSLSASSATLKPALKLKVSSPQSQTLLGKTNQQNQTSTYFYAAQKTSLSSHASEIGLCNSWPTKDHMEETREGLSGQEVRQTQSLEKEMFGESKDIELDRQIEESGVKGICKKRQRAGAVINKANKKKRKIAGREGADVTPSSANGGVNTVELSENSYSRKVYWLRAGYTANRESKYQKPRKTIPEFQTNKALKRKDQERCSDGMDKEQPAVYMARRGKPPKKTVDGSSAGFRATTCSGKDDLQLTNLSRPNSQSVQNDGCDLVKRKDQAVCLVTKWENGRPTKEKEQAIGPEHTESDLNDEQSAGPTVSTYAGHQDSQKAERKMTNGCERNKTQGPAVENASVELEEVSAEVNWNVEPNVDGSQTKKTSIVDQVFHQSIFSVGASVSRHFPPIGQQPGSSSLNVESTPKTERKRSAGPSLPDIIKKFRKLTDRGHVRRRRKLVMDNNEGEEKELAKEGKMKTRVEVDDRVEEVMDNTKEQTVNSENSLKISSKRGNGLTGENPEVGRNQADIGSRSIHPDISSHKSHLYTVPLASSFGSNGEMENDPQNKSTEISVSTEETSDGTEGFHLDESADTHAVHPEANQVWNNEKVKGNAEMEAAHVVEIPRRNDKQHAAEVNDAELEIMEESDLDGAGHGEEAGTPGLTTEKSDVEESLSRFSMTNAESAACEEELTGPQHQRTGVGIMSSNEAFTRTHSPASPAEEAHSVQLGEKPEQTNISNTSFNTMDLPTAVSVTENPETEAQTCDEDEEVVVDDLSSSPGMLIQFPSESIILTEEEDELEEEEEEVDVTGEDTN